MSNYLCEELIVDIFTRLPSKSLLRFRSVSKSLCSCIESPSFICMHASRSPQRRVITHRVTRDHIKEYGVEDFWTLHEQRQLPLCPIRAYIGITPLKFPHIYDRIFGSCNGILCLFNYETSTISLWNPSIMSQLIVPDCPLRRFCIGQIGFGFDPITNDHKIVCVQYETRENACVYSMKMGSWRPIASPFPITSYCEVLSSACYVNGVLHWVVECFIERYYIMTFDLCTHEFGMIDLPELGELGELTTIQGCLGVISSCIWVRRDGYWSVVFKPQTNEVEEVLNEALELASNGDMLLRTFSEGFQVYNMETGERSRLMAFNDTCVLLDMHMYVESLQLFGMGTACQVNHRFLEEKKEKTNSATFIT